MGIVPYEEVKFSWITDHYDIHLTGFCVYEGKRCKFTTMNYEYTEENNSPLLLCKIEHLSKFEIFVSNIDQTLFELLVSKRWSYKDGKIISFVPNRYYWLTGNIYYYGKDYLMKIRNIFKS